MSSCDRQRRGRRWGCCGPWWRRCGPAGAPAGRARAATGRPGARSPRGPGAGRRRGRRDSPARRRPRGCPRSCPAGFLAWSFGRAPMRDRVMCGPSQAAHRAAPAMTILPLGQAQVNLLVVPGAGGGHAGDGHLVGRVGRARLGSSEAGSGSRWRRTDAPLPVVRRCRCGRCRSPRAAAADLAAGGDQLVQRAHVGPAAGHDDVGAGAVAAEDAGRRSRAAARRTGCGWSPRRWSRCPR